MKSYRPAPLVALLVIALSGCGPPAAETTAPTPAAHTAVPAEGPLLQPAIVTTHTAAPGRLALERVTTGKLRARRRVTLKSPAAGLVVTAPREGQQYAAADLLFATDPRPREMELGRARAALEEADYRRRELLLRLQTNLPPEDSSAVTDLARANIRLQAGLPTAEAQLAEAEFNLTQTRLPAPFAGRMADVQIQPGDRVGIGTEIGDLIDENSLEAEFFLLEQELGDLSPGRTVTVSPVARPEWDLPARLDVLNPAVEEDGLLRVRAKLTGQRRRGLYPGMNVTVTVAGRAPELIIVPKAAVLERSGRQLVFVHDAARGQALWQYVTVAYENADRVALSAGVEAGQSVIVSGHLTLDHQSPVQLAARK